MLPTTSNLDHRMKLIPRGHEDETGFHLDADPGDEWVHERTPMDVWRERHVSRLRAWRVRQVTMMLVVLLSGLLGYWLFNGSSRRESAQTSPSPMSQSGVGSPNP